MGRHSSDPELFLSCIFHHILYTVAMSHGLTRRENTCSCSLLGAKGRDDCLACGKYYPCCYTALEPSLFASFMQNGNKTHSIKCYAYLCNNCSFKLWHIVYKDTLSTDPWCNNTAPSLFYPASIPGIPHCI